MSGFFEEVQRRKVYRVAAAYIVAAGFMIQIASAAFPAWELPNWSLRLVDCALVGRISNRAHSGLGLRRHAARDSRRAREDPPGKRRRNVVALIATGVAISAVAGFFLSPALRRPPESTSRLPCCLFKT